MRAGWMLPLLLSLGVLGAPARAASAHGVEIVFVAPEGSEYHQMEAHFSLDGTPLAVPDDSRPGQRYLLYAGDLPVGDHRLNVDLQYRRGDDTFFSRQARAMVQVKGTADFNVEPSQHLVITGRIRERPDPDHGGQMLPAFIAGISVLGPATEPVTTPAVAVQPPHHPVVPPAVEKKPVLAPAQEKPVVVADSHDDEASPLKTPVATPKHGTTITEQAAHEATSQKAVAPKAKRRKKKRAPASALARLRAHLRSTADEPKPKAEAPPKVDPAVARLRALLRKSVKNPAPAP